MELNIKYIIQTDSTSSSDDPNGSCIPVAVYFTVYMHSQFTTWEIISIRGRRRVPLC